MEINGKLIHFTGIGGISMSALACFAMLNGAYVTGSDSNSIPNKQFMDSIGIISYIGSNPDIAANADLLVYTSAVTELDNEVRSCKAKNIPVIPRHEFLAMVSKSYRDVIAISGTHGKTTTTAMLAAIMKKADYPFAAHIGGSAEDINGNFYHKGNDLFITEACEYKRSFLSLRPTLSIILNIDNDHPDTYKSKEELIDVFHQFADRSDVALVFNGFNENECKDDHIITYGYDNTCDFYAININHDANEKYGFDLCLNEQILIEDIKLSVYGRHNINNAMCAGAAASMWGVPSDIIRKGLNDFKGVGRRFEKRGKFNNAEIISDYAHHPTEIKAVIETARHLTKGKLIVVFEPHTFSRTKALINEFSVCFIGADNLILLPTYAAREVKADGMDSDDLIKRIVGVNVIKAENYNEAREFVKKDLNSDDLVLVLGAGSIDKLANMLCEFK